MENTKSNIGSNLAGSVGTPVKQPEAQQEFNSLSIYIEKLYKISEILEGKLSSILRNDSVKEEESPKEVEPSTGLASQIRGNRKGVEKVINILQSIITRLEL